MSARQAEVERKRRKALRRFYELLEKLEAPTGRASGRFPFGVLERLVDQFLIALERGVDRLVSAALDRVAQFRSRLRR
jgi:hypothetical protein